MNALRITRKSIIRERAAVNRRLGVARVRKKLTARDIPLIRGYLADGHDIHTVGYWFGVTHLAIWQIQHGKTWRDVP